MMLYRTLNTLWGYLKSRLGMTKGGQSFSDIYNYLPVSAQLASSGQPRAAEFPFIQQAGYQVVINLAPSHAENAIDDEEGIVTGLGMQYIHIPVDFKHPTERDFEQFCSSMQQASDRKIWVHCAANMRVSAFIYRYRRDVLGENEANARKTLLKIWQPYGVWKQFISRN